ncbi:signal peptide peptidase-like 2B isoform X1 [Paramuricea clavata]|uniref:Signal peptide peptidase-like 2B isoform X1 n=1 Tax=Paramuricea clavata TaxID=317549 RepID=A0A6S7GVB5_PARCT|nr:signal peptide peptidase-like 2B isoform X1 [Paramuricea clavata]
MAFILSFVIAIALAFHQVDGEYAVLRASTNSESKDFCVTYYPLWHDLPTELSAAPQYEYQLVPIEDLCSNEDDDYSNDYSNEAVFSWEKSLPNCTFTDRVVNAQSRNATELVIVNTNDQLFIAVASSPADYNMSKIPLAVMTKSDFQTMQALGKFAFVQLYVPPIAAIDTNLVVIWLLAVGTIVIGAYWSGVIANEQREKSAENKASSGSSSEEEEAAMQITPLMVVIFVVFICLFLLLVYYLYKYVVYIIIGVFAIASASGMFECLNALALKLPFCTCRVRVPSFINRSGDVLVKSVIVLAFSLGIAIWWVIVRNESYGWVLQDILGVLFCISLLKNLRLPSLKICSLLLILLLIYDVFFVFITPLFSAGHNSVMVDVATGEGHKEQLPMVLKVPRIIRSALLICERRDYSLLGFGDILVPGLFVSFCHSFDRMAKTPYRIYYVASSIAYGVGLIITFAALYLMKEGQPALVYLVPSTLLTVIVISLIRKEFCDLWHGTYRFSHPTIQPLVQSDNEENCEYDRDNDTGSTGNVNNESRSSEKERLIN